MYQIFIVITGLILLSIILLRAYFRVEKGMTLSTAIFGQKRIFRHPPESNGFEVTADELLLPQDQINSKNVLKSEILLKKAEVQMNKGNFKEVEKIIIQSISLNPASVEAFNKLGLIYLHQQQWSKAENIFSKLSVSVSSEPAYFSNLALALYGQKKLEEAKTAYKKAIELDNTRPGRFFSLAQINSELNELEEAEQNFLLALELDPRNLDYQLSLAHFYADHQRKSDALNMLDKIFVLNPNEPNAHELLAEIKRIQEEGTHKLEESPDPRQTEANEKNEKEESES